MTRSDSAKRPRILDSAIAIALDGTVLLSLSQAVHETDRASLMKLALDEPGDIFVGVALDKPDAGRVRKWLDDAGIEVAARLNGQRRPRKGARRIRTASKHLVQ